MESNHYFDWAAATPPDMDIIKSAYNDAASSCGNPSSAHSAGRSARALLEAARAECASNLGVMPSQVFFTSGGTESCHIPLLAELMRAHKGTVLISAIEHPAIRAQAKVLRSCGVNVISIPPNKDGIITSDAVLSHLTEDTTLVCVMAVNNETGAVQPITEIASSLQNTAGHRRVRLHVDCVQAAGKVPLQLEGVDSAAFSAHKICGPRGIGILYIKDGAPSIEPFLRGGGQESGVRSGTENVAGAIAFAKCLARYTLNHSKSITRAQEQQRMTETFIERISSIPSCRIIPQSRAQDTCLAEQWSPWIVQAAFVGIPGPVMLRALDAMGYCISTGSACSSRKNERPVLAAMGVAKDIQECAVRFSFGYTTTSLAMDDLAAAVQDIATRFK